jgi:hypothetical protein
VFFYLPSMLLSGFMFSFEGMPAWAPTVGAAPCTSSSPGTQKPNRTGAVSDLIILPDGI